MFASNVPLVDLPLFDAIVVGAGIEGSATAYHLAKNSQTTLLLEQFPLPHSRGSSHGQSRITRYAYPQDFYVQMMLEAYPMWDTLSKEAEEEIFKECGLLNLGVENGKFLTSVSSAMSRHGLQFESLTPKQVKERFPMFKYPANYAALLDPKAGILRADKALAAFQRVFKMNGGVIHDKEPVTAIFPGQPYVTIATTTGQYRAKSLVLATGAWTPKILGILGLRLPFRVMRMTVCYWRESWTKAHSSDRFPCFLDSGESQETMSVYGLPSEEYPGHVKACLHVGPDIDPDNRDDADDRWVREAITSYVTKCMPGLVPKPSIVETCIYTNTPDENAVIDRHPQYSNIIIASGFSGHGFKLAPAVGKAVAELVLQNKLSYDMRPFAISRFSTIPPGKL